MNIQDKQNEVPLSTNVLEQQNRSYKGSGGVSQENRSLAFKPAFLDEKTGKVYLARFADGRVAPMHIVDGLPDELITERSDDGSVIAIRKNVIAGFTRDFLFYTRDQAAKAISYFNMQADLVSAGVIR